MTASSTTVLTESPHSENGETTAISWVEQFYTNDKLNPGPNGEPAYSKGFGRDRPEHYINDERVSNKVAKWYQSNHGALAAVIETGISPKEFDQLLKDCDEDVDAAITLVRLQE